MSVVWGESLDVMLQLALWWSGRLTFLHIVPVFATCSCCDKTLGQSNVSKKRHILAHGLV